MTTPYQYSSCSYCGSAVDEQHVRIEMWFGDSLVVFEHVPAGVCNNCGEEYFAADTQDKMLSLISTPAKKHMQVPVYSFSDPLTIAKAAASRKKKEREESDREPEQHLVSDEDIAEMFESSPEEWDEQ
jgi:YgiT-type zinc finger domain-containing protein